METETRFPVPGAVIAAVTCGILMLASGEIVLSLIILLLWVGTLWLGVATPRHNAAGAVTDSPGWETLSEVVEDSATPFLIVDSRRVVFANRSARQVMGSHGVGQDPRVAIRHPEAVALMEGSSGDRTTIRGLVRPHDIWELNLQDRGDFSVIELVDRTSEADIGRAHTDFVANASHELRTPLASVIGYVETLQDGTAADDPAATSRFLSIIEREARRMKALVSDLMSLSRIEAEKHDSPDEKVALVPIVRRAAQDAAGPDQGARLEIRASADPQILGDTQQLEQLVRNLVENGLKYGASDGAVTIEISETDNGMAALEITDHGEGIDPQHLPHLTRRFYRTDPGRSRASGGTGLGLAIVKHIVERHRGKIDIQSVKGEGTSVLVRLPQIAIEPASVS